VNARLRSPVLGAGVLLVAAVVVPLLLGGRWLFLATDAAVHAIAAVGLALVVARMGLVSLGHGAFFGIAAYGSALLAKDLRAPVLVGVVAGIVLAMLYAALVGPLALRTRGLGFVMVTLAFGELVRVAANQTVGVTGGDTGLSGIPAVPWGGDDRVGLVVTVALLAAVLALGGWLLATTLGRSIDAARQDEDKARALGYAVDRSRAAVFVLSAGIAGLGGALFAHHTSFVSPVLLSWLTSGELLVMVLVGGGRSLVGAAVGAFVLVFLEDAVSSRTDRWELVLGLVFVTVVLSGMLSRSRRPRRPVAAGSAA
jgi:branched-chain amino acid transport system permease protein